MSHQALKSILNRCLKCCAFLVASLFILGAKQTTQYKIIGIKGDAMQNIQQRLKEAYQAKKINQVPPEAIITQVEKALYPYGFFKPQIRIQSIGAKKLTIRIHPGPRMKITSLNIRIIGDGAQNTQILKVLNEVPLKKGQAYLNKNYEDSKDKLENAAENQGYLRAHFEKAEILIDRTQYSAEITLIMNTGPQYYFGQARFNPTHISPKLLHRFIPFRKGAPYSTDQVLALESNLSASGYFKSVVVKPNLDTIRHVPIDVHLEDVNRINYSLGIGYGTDTGPRGRAGVHIVPVNRRGHKFNAIAQASLNENALLAQYLIPGRNPIVDNFSFSSSISNLKYNSGYGNAFLLSAGQQHIKKSHQRVLSLNALNERFNYTGETKRTKMVIYPKASLAWNKRTDPLFSPSGYNISLNGFASSKSFLSDVSIAQGTIDAKAAITIDPVRTRFYAHAIQGLTHINNIDNLPLSLSMLLGGAEDMRAFSFNSIGPGKTMSYVGLELQKETVDKWYLVGFIDSGDVYKPSLRQFKYDAGVGIMWVSPVGPIKLEIAQEIDRNFQRQKGRSPKLVINMGPDL